MKCNCKVTELILVAVIIIFALWESTIAWLPSMWVIVAAAVLIAIHSLKCNEMCKVKKKK